jgi:hypothetical protein
MEGRLKGRVKSSRTIYSKTKKTKKIEVKQREGRTETKEKSQTYVVCELLDAFS